jgi:hypothetical protein
MDLHPYDTEHHDTTRHDKEMVILYYIYHNYIHYFLNLILNFFF